jgi:hypothetical protein
MNLGVVISLWLSIFLCSCQSVPEVATPAIVVKDNKEKDTYIDKVESIASDAASGLVAIKETIPKESVAYQLLESQIIRLTAIKEPSVVKVSEYRETISKNDTKAASKDKDLAIKEDNETTLIWEQVAILDIELSEAKAAKAQAEAIAQRAVKDKALDRITMLGMALILAGVIAVAFTTKKISGMILIVSGVACASSAWIFDSPIWQYILIGVGGFFALNITYVVFRFTKNYFAKQEKHQGVNAGQEDKIS